MPMVGMARPGSLLMVWGADEVIGNIEKYRYATHYNIRSVWKWAGEDVAAEAKRLIGPRGPMRAFITGKLQRSIKGGAVRKKGTDIYQVRVVATASYAMIVHQGLGYQPYPRPFLKQAMKNRQNAIRRRIVIEQNKLERRLGNRGKAGSRYVRK